MCWLGQILHVKHEVAGDDGANHVPPGPLAAAAHAAMYHYVTATVHFWHAASMCCKSTCVPSPLPSVSCGTRCLLVLSVRCLQCKQAGCSSEVTMDPAGSSEVTMDAAMFVFWGLVGR